MPLVNIRSSVPKTEKANILLKEISSCIAGLTGKPERYVMTCMETNLEMTFGGLEKHCCYVEVKSIGGINPNDISKELCNIISKHLEIKEDMIYINFEDIQARNWGFNGSTFG